MTNIDSRAMLFERLI